MGPLVPPSTAPGFVSAARGKRFYDVAVLGPDLGGAVAAALLAKKGLRVLLATIVPTTVAREADGWLLPTAHPMVPPLRQLSGAMGALDELGIGQELQRLTAATSGAFQILSDKLRLSLPADLSRRRTELKRELGEKAALEAESALDSLERLGRPWDGFLMEPPPLPARGFFERRRLQKVIPQAPQLPLGLVGAALEALAPFAANLVGETAPEATARESAALLRAPLRLWGGAAQIADLLRKKAIADGAEIALERCANLRLDRKGVAFELGGAEISARTVILACSGSDVAALCEGGGRTERKLAEEAALPVGQRVVLAHFVVRAEGLPLALEEAALLLGHSSGPMLISSLPARKAKGEPTTERLMTVARVAPAEAPPKPDELLAQVREALEPVLPFFERHVLHQSADVSPALAHTVLQPSEQVEPIGLRPDSEAHERALFASDAVYPGFGLEGSILGARAAADKALELSGRKQVSAT
jgi:hypothetical protein